METFYCFLTFFNPLNNIHKHMMNIEALDLEFIYMETYVCLSKSKSSVLSDMWVVFVDWKCVEF